MKYVKIRYMVMGEVQEVICMRKEYAYGILRHLRSSLHITNIQVLGLENEILAVKSAKASKL